MKLIYKPFGILVGLGAGMLGRFLFSKLWGLVAEEEPPEPTTEETTWPKLLVAAALQGAVMRGTNVAVNRAGALGWRHLTGVWPGEKRPDRE